MKKGIDINEYADKVFSDLVDFTNKKWVINIFGVYIECSNQALSRVKVAAKKLDHELYKRLVIEVISFSLFSSLVASNQFFIKRTLFSNKPDVEARKNFRNKICNDTKRWIQEKGLDTVKEFVLKQIRNEIVFDLGENIDFWKRNNEYAELFYLKKEGKESTLFGKYICRAVDPYHPKLDTAGAEYAGIILNDVNFICTRHSKLI